MFQMKVVYFNGTYILYHVRMKIKVQNLTSVWK